MEQGWDFRSSFSAASGVIPTLLIALVLENRVLPVVAANWRTVRSTVDRLPRVLLWLLRVVGRYIPDGLVQLFAPTSAVLLAIFAEMVALAGVGAPASWFESPWGGFLASIGLVVVGISVFSLLISLAAGLFALARRAEGAASGTSGEGARSTE